jgi:hypothetical protein
MTKSSSKEIRVHIEIAMGPISPVQEQAWNRFWRKLVSRVNGNK